MSDLIQRLRAEWPNRALELEAATALESQQARIRTLEEALREIAGMRGHTVRSFEEIRDGWKDACIIAFGQAADIADKALSQERGDE